MTVNEPKTSRQTFFSKPDNLKATLIINKASHCGLKVHYHTAVFCTR